MQHSCRVNLGEDVDVEVLKVGVDSFAVTYSAENRHERGRVQHYSRSRDGDLLSAVQFERGKENTTLVRRREMSPISRQSRYQGDATSVLCGTRSVPSSSSKRSLRLKYSASGLKSNSSLDLATAI